jgi:RNA polymerase sigma factor (sigma-70 family)
VEEPLGTRREQSVHGRERVYVEPFHVVARDDAESIRRSLDEPDRFSAIFEQYVVEISRFMRRRVPSAAVDDLVAETFIAAFKARGGYDQGRPFALPWLYGIATNIIRHYFRDASRRHQLELKLDRIEEPTDGGMGEADARFESDRLRALLMQIDGKSRDSLMLFACEGLSYEDVAQALGVPLGTVRSRIHRARGQLRELLSAVGARDE